VTEEQVSITDTKTLEVQRADGKPPFRITVPKASRVTFGPWSPQTGATPEGARYSDRALVGTLRVYAPGPKTSDNVLAVFSGVAGFRDLSIEYAEQVAVEVGSIMWNSDKRGYSREVKVTRDEQWGEQPTKQVMPGVTPEDEGPF
jgi:hypothetical protein